MVAIGLAALADENIVKHLCKGEPVKKVFNQSSMIPKLLMGRIKAWPSLKGRDYKI